MNIDEAREKVRAFKTEAASAKTEVYEMNRLLTTYIALGRKIGSPELTFLINSFESLRIKVEMAYRSLMAFYTIGGPIGWAVGIGGLITLTLMTAMEVRRPQY